MDVYGRLTPEVFRIDDFLDFSNEEDIFSSSKTAIDFDLNHHYQPPPTDSIADTGCYYHAPPNSVDFTDKLCVPSDDVAELEWLSNFVEDSSNNFPSNNLTQTMYHLNNTNTILHSKSRSKRSRNSNSTSWNTSSLQRHKSANQKNSNQDENSGDYNSNKLSNNSKIITSRKCTHCASEKTPQWRTGPLGPKTLCNACGVRYKSGRLVPEYRPAASPTFVLTQHSNSHRKVMELRRQKEIIDQQQQHGMYGHHYPVC
ncbi:GATA transcription factor 4-like [Solanum lycopersicum]|uniref:GATA transcription factor n=1 Tax=Solanum lycopersicum TaxID=4081 RepID=A0A3Q7ID17_SOLLC|nr:GATA transcription factor 4-like [Solanum lycopersicum]